MYLMESRRLLLVFANDNFYKVKVRTIKIE